MKMVKSLLLGSAAGLVAVAGAQAADLPVKAAAVQYVKICSLYGAGFYYVPGTDMCIKIGGWVRGYYGFNANGSTTTGNLVGNFNNRTTNDTAWRVRGYITADSRSQTAFGTVRGYIAVGYSGEAVQGGTAPTFSANRGFIQWAGFTFGLAQSFYDFYSAPAVSFFGGYVQPSSDTGDGGQYVAAYTMQFGNGWSSSISLEDPVFNRRSGIFNAGIGTAVFTQTGVLADSYGGITWPDVVGNIRVDQAWGGAQIMGAIQDARATYYGATDNTGNPSDRVAFAVGAGLKLNAPMLGKGDFFQTQVNYTQGAVGYVIATNNRYAKYGSDTNYGTMVAPDAVYGTTGDLQLTTAWGINASYEHHWNDQWKTSLYGGYLHFSFNDTASNLLAVAAVRTFGAPVAGACGTVLSAAGCFDSSYWDIGTRTQWNVTKDFYMGLDVVYTHLNTMAKGVSFAMPANGTRPAATRILDDQDAIVAQFRVHRDFYP